MTAPVVLFRMLFWRRVLFQDSNTPAVGIVHRSRKSLTGHGHSAVATHNQVRTGDCTAERETVMYWWQLGPNILLQNEAIEDIAQACQPHCNS